MSAEVPISSQDHADLSPPRSSPKIIFAISLLGIVFIILFLYWFFSWRWAETTDNAYIKGEITPISSKVNGHIVELNVVEGDEVKQGQILAKVDPQEYQRHCLKTQQEVESAEATLKQLPVQVAMLEVGLEQIDVQMESAKASLEKDQRAYERSKSLYKSDISSVKDYDNTKTAYIQSKVMVNQLELTKKAMLYNIQSTKLNIVKQTAAVEGLKEQLKLMEISLNDTDIIAPISGVVGNRSIRKGQYVRTGSILLSIVPLDNIWIMANYKETQISRFAKDQRVQFTVDSYPDKTFQGKIISINPASGAEFSLIPPENATGNFTKIVQRIPIKISIENPENYRLVPGMSVSTTINTKNS